MLDSTEGLFPMFMRSEMKEAQWALQPVSLTQNWPTITS